jgi:hypothetical protein
VKDFLAEVNVSLDAVIQYLIGDINSMSTDPEAALTRRQAALPKDFDLTDPKVIAAKGKATLVKRSELEKAEIVCSLFKEATGISIWEVVKKMSSVVKDSMSPIKQTTSGATAAPNHRGDKDIALMTGGNPWPYSLDSYASLNCMVCYM